MSETTLAASMTAADLTLSVTANLDFADTEPPYRIAIDGEEMKVTERSGTTWTVERSAVLATEALVIDSFDREETAALGDVSSSFKWRGDDNDADVEYDVTGGAAVLTVLTAGKGNIARFSAEGQGLDAQLRARFQCLDQLNSDIDLRMRRWDGDNLYRARLTISGAGAMSLRLAKVVASAVTNLAAAVVPPGTVALDDWFWIAIQVTGTSPTELSAKAWREVDGEPAAWQTSVTDSEAILQLLFDARGNVSTEYRVAPLTGTGIYWMDDWTITNIPVGISHANGATVTSIEEWETPIAIAAGIGAPISNPPSGAAYVDGSVSPPVLYVRVGNAWYSVTLT